MKNSWMPIAAGILDLIGGVGELGFGAYFICILISDILGGAGEIYVQQAFAAWFGPFALFGIVAIIGGIFALKRKRWKLALTGSFMAFLPWIVLIVLYHNPSYREWVLFFLIPLILGVTVPVLIVLSRKQFT